MLAFAGHHWHLPPNPKWDVTGFGLGDFAHFGLVLVNLSDLPEYCEKLMYCARPQRTPMHAHREKQEDIICRMGTMAIEVMNSDGELNCLNEGRVRVLVNGVESELESGSRIHLMPGERITLFAGVYHEFWPVSGFCIISEVSTRNDDLNDNFFANKQIARFDDVDEDAPALYPLVSD